MPRRCSPVATVRRRSWVRQGGIYEAVKPFLAGGEVGDWIAAGDGEHKLAGTNPRQFFEDGKGRGRQRDGVDFFALGAVAAEDDGVVLDFRPAQTSNLAPSRTSEDQ